MTISSLSSLHSNTLLTKTFRYALLLVLLIALSDKACMYASQSQLQILQEKAKTRPLRLLSLDGGGIRGLIELEWLKSLRAQTNMNINELFDAIIGTSTGGIIAGGLAVGRSIDEIIAIYEEKKDQIFSNVGARPLTQVKGFAGTMLDTVNAYFFNAAYGAQGIEKVLADEFSNTRLSQASIPVLITAVALTSATYKLKIFNSIAASQTKSEDYQLKDVLRATSAAPTYFPPAIIEGEEYYIDGGVGCNNPALEGYKALKKMVPNAQIEVVSMSAGQYLNDREHAHNNSKAGCALAAVNCFMKLQSDETDSNLRELLKNNLLANYFRLHTTALDEASECMDNISDTNIRQLKRIALDETKRQNFRELVEFFWKKRNLPKELRTAFCNLTYSDNNKIIPFTVMVWQSLINLSIVAKEEHFVITSSGITIDPSREEKLSIARSHSNNGRDWSFPGALLDQKFAIPINEACFIPSSEIFLATINKQGQSELYLAWMHNHNGIQNRIHVMCKKGLGENWVPLDLTSLYNKTDGNGSFTLHALSTLNARLVIGLMIKDVLRIFLLDNDGSSCTELKINRPRLRNAEKWAIISGSSQNSLLAVFLNQNRISSGTCSSEMEWSGIVNVISVADAKNTTIAAAEFNGNYYIAHAGPHGNGYRMTIKQSTDAQTWKDFAQIDRIFTVKGIKVFGLNNKLWIAHAEDHGQVRAYPIFLTSMDLK